jgi:hypothetical protein
MLFHDDICTCLDIRKQIFAHDFAIIKKTTNANCMYPVSGFINNSSAIHSAIEK